MLHRILMTGIMALCSIGVTWADVWTVLTPRPTSADPAWNKHFDSDHFAVWYSDAYPCTQAQAQAALDQLEKVLDFYVNQKKFCPKILTRSPNYKVNAHIISGGLYGGLDNQGNPGMWIGVASLADNWGLAHEFNHALQGVSGGFSNGGSENYAGWFWESHSNWMPHQMYPTNAHCTEMYTRQANLYYGSHRNRYCNWQFLEYLKEKKDFQFVNDIWNKSAVDVLETIMKNGGWDVYTFGDLFADYASKNVIWDYTNGATYRSTYGSQSNQNKWRRYTYLQAIDTANNRYVVPFEFAPQRYGYNLVRLYPDAGSTSVKVRFRGCVQKENANVSYKKTNQWEPAAVPVPGSDWRYSIAAVTSASTARYSEIKRFSDGAADLSFDVSGASEVYLVVTATPTVYARIVWDQMYYTIYRYPYMVEVTGAKPQGFEPVTVAGKTFANGGGFVANTANVASTAYVGPYARVLGGTIQGTARIEDRAIIKGGTISGTAVVKGNAMVAGGTISGAAIVSDNAAVWGGTITDNGKADGCANISQVTINGNGRVGGNCWMLSTVTVSGTAQYLGDGEVVASKSTGVAYGLIDNSDEGNVGNSRTAPVTEVTNAGPFTWYDVVGVQYDSRSKGMVAAAVEQVVTFSHKRNGVISMKTSLPSGCASAELKITDIKGRLIWSTTVTDKAVITLPDAVAHSTNLLVWKLNGSNIDKSGSFSNTRL